MTERSLSLLRRLARGDDQTHRTDAMPFRLLMQLGYAVRLGEARGLITPTGRAFLAGVDYVTDKL